MQQEPVAPHAGTESLAEIIHRLQAPLYALRLAHAALLENNEHTLTSEQLRLLGECQARVETLSEYVQAIAKRDQASTDHVLHIASHTVATLISAALAEFYLPISVKALHLVVEVVPHNLSLECDYSAMLLAITNILDNAVKYTGVAGTIVVQAAALSHAVQITISDTGIGVPPDQVSVIYTKFSRLANAEQVDPHGSGVGLYIAKKIVSAHHGTIVYSDNQPRGAVFTITLPLVRHT